LIDYLLTLGDGFGDSKLAWDVSQFLQDSKRGSIAAMDWRVNTDTNDALLHAQ